MTQIGTCGLHTIHGIIKAGVTNSDQNIRKTFKAPWKLLYEAPVQMELFKKVTETFIYPLPYFGHCWYENEYSARSGELILLEVKKFVAYLKILSKSKQKECSLF